MLEHKKRPNETGRKHPKGCKELKPLSLHPYDPDEALRRLMEVDPEKVEGRLKEEKEARERKKKGN